MKGKFRILAGLAGGWALASGIPPAAAQTPLPRGADLFRQCAACHSLEPGRHLTGPSLAGVFGRRAGTAEGFRRYSEPLKNSRLVWDERSLDRWLENPQALVPGNGMPFPGIDDGRARAGLIAYLKAVATGKEGPAPGAGSGMGMMMGQGPQADLKQAGRDSQVVAVRYCPDAYRVATAAGGSFTFWEHNLRFKTDSGAAGPQPGKPVLLRAGMSGDRAFVVFAGPEEMAAFIKRQCD